MIQVEYMVWLRSRRAEGLRRSYKRIIDVEKEGYRPVGGMPSEGLGDDYGIYGFSGYGAGKRRVLCHQGHRREIYQHDPAAHRQDRSAARDQDGAGDQARHVETHLPGKPVQDSCS